MAGINALLVIQRMTECAFRRCAGISAGMAFLAIDYCMCACQREVGVVVIKPIIAFPIGVTPKARLAVVHIPVHADVLWVCFTLYVTGHTGEDAVVAWCGVALRALRPDALVRCAINWEMLIVVIKRRWLPCRFRVACCTVL